MSQFFAVIGGSSESGPPPRPGPSPALSAPSSPATRVTLDYRFDAANFFDTPQKRDALRQAVAAAVRVLGGVSTTIPGPDAAAAWDADLVDPVTGQQTAVRDLLIGPRELVFFPGSRELDGAGGGAAGDGLSLGGPGRFKQPGMPELDVAGDSGAPERGGGTLLFDPTPGRPWHFDPTAAPPPSRYDFPTAATRAVAQALGFGTGRRWHSWRPYSGDFFDPLADAFQGHRAMAAYNGPGAFTPVPLDPTGRYFADTTDDDAPASAMRATLRPGQRLELSPLDYAALQDIGWETVRRVSMSVAPRPPADVTSPVLIDVTYEGAEPWAPQQLRLYPPYNSVFAAPRPVYEGPPLYVHPFGEPQVLGPGTRRVTYAFNPPGGTWDTSETGHFLVAIEGTPEAGRIGEFTFDPGSPPTSTLETSDLTVPTPSPHRLVVTHADNVALDLSSFAADDLLVTGPGGAEVLTTGAAPASPPVSLPPGAPARREFYAQPPGGAWGPEDNGTYTVSLRPGRVRDAAGNVSPGGVLGAFEVAINPSTSPSTGPIEDGSGRTVTVTLRGPGTISVYPAAIGSADIGRIELNDTTESSALLIQGRGAIVRDIICAKSLGAILAPEANLTGQVTIGGALRRLRLGGTSGGVIRIGPGRGGLDAAINQPVNLTIESATPIRSLTVDQWLRTSPSEASVITAPSIKSITATRPTGTFSADVVTDTLGGARFAGSLRDATLRAGASIGPISATHMDGCRIFAGVAAGSTALPASKAEFSNPAASIKSVSVKWVFSSTLIAAPTVGRMSLDGAGTSPGGVAPGVAADRLRSLSRGSLRLSRLDDPADSRVEGELTIRLL